MDPLWEKYHGLSPYNYVLNNPLVLIDPNGMYVDEFDQERQGLEGEGSRVSSRSAALASQIAGDSKKGKKGKKEKESSVAVISASGVASISSGFNFELGLAFDNNGNYLFIASAGLSIGIGYNLGLEGVLIPNYSLEEARGAGAVYNTKKNTAEVEISIGLVGVNTVLNSQSNGYNPIGGGLNVSAGIPFSAVLNGSHFILSSKTYNLMNRANSLIEKNEKNIREGKPTILFTK